MKRRLFKKITSLTLAFLMLATLIPAFAVTIGAAETSVKLQKATEITDGETYVVYYNGRAMKAAVASSRLSYADISIDNDGIYSVDDALLWKIEKQGDNYTLYNETTASYAASTGAKNKAQLLTDPTDTKAQWTVTATEGTFEFENVANAANGVNKTLRNNGTYGFACYATSTGGALTLYKIVVDEGCAHTNVTNFPAQEATCTEDGYTAYQTCADCGFGITEKTIIPATRHFFVNNVCSECGENSPVEIGAVVAFVGSKSDGTAKGELGGFDANAEFGKAISSAETPAGYFPLTVVDGYTNGTFAFKNGDNYITCFGEKNVNLSTTLDAKSSWMVTTDQSGDLEIASCYNSAYKLRYNGNSPRFTTYTSGQYPINIVKLPTDPTVHSLGLSLNKGVTVKVTYYLPIAWMEANAGAKIVFKSGSSVIAEHTAFVGASVYTADLIPSCINDELTVELQLVDGTPVGDAKSVSVAAYKEKVDAAAATGKLNLSDEKYNALVALLGSILTYADASEEAVAGNLTEDFSTVADLNDGITQTVPVFTGAAGVLGKYASVRLNVNTANVQSTYKLTVKLGDTTLIDNGNLVDYITADNQLVITELYPADFEQTISVIISDGTSDIVTANFTFNSYLKALYANESQSVVNMAAATFRYGLNVKAFVEAE